MIEQDIIAWVNAEDAAINLRQAASWLRSRDPAKSRELDAEALRARAEAITKRESVIAYGGDKPSSGGSDKPAS